MEILIGFAVGYYMGAKAGPQKLDELGEACRTIAGSPEFQALLTVGTTLLAKVAVEQQKAGGGFGMGQIVGDQLKQVLATLSLPRAA
jgi:hypothetical protein